MWVKFRKQLRTSPRPTFVRKRMAGDFGQKPIGATPLREERDRDAKTRTSSRSKGFFLATKPSRD
jgi:hypothetical protein